jgi:hypothetical protein
MQYDNQLPIRVVIYFAHNPSEVLSTRDLSLKFGYPLVKVVDALRVARLRGYLIAELPDGETTRRFGLIWSAGPRLLEVIGKGKP